MKTNVKSQDDAYGKILFRTLLSVLSLWDGSDCSETAINAEWSMLHVKGLTKYDRVAETVPWEAFMEPVRRRDLCSIATVVEVAPGGAIIRA